MRRHLSILAGLTLLLVPALAFGQIKLQKARFAQKGKFHIGGGISYMNRKTQMTEPAKGGEDGMSQIKFAPTVGYFVIPGLEVGGTLQYDSTTLSPEEGDESSSSRFWIGPHVAYYHKVSPVVFPYGRAKLMYLLSSDNDAWGDHIDKESGYELRVGAGVAIPIGHKVGGVLSIGLDYFMRKMTTTPKEGDDTVMESSGIELATGISLYF